MEETYLLSCLIRLMEVGCQHLLCNRFETPTVRLLEGRDWGQALHITTILQRYTSRSILAYFLDEAHWFNR